MSTAAPALRRRVVGGVALVLGVGWLGIVGLLWLSGPRTNGIHIRWMAGTTPDSQRQVAAELNLECERLVDGRTWFCAVLDGSPTTLPRIIRHPAVEDTHYVNRSSGVLEDAPIARTRLWAGRKSPIVGSVGLMVLAGLLALAGGYLLFRSRLQGRE